MDLTYLIKQTRLKMTWGCKIYSIGPTAAMIITWGGHFW